ncbi:unnamed protein product [Cylindrotheca closterium]|uniref:Uncharacterized protein n=1 Tax=Cylindrotheca closterium TaxID=2856 RepID=A0AAD2G9V7_9STRA|nr:unnamed protein product [Cylindrotheca closterium]
MADTPETLQTEEKKKVDDAPKTPKTPEAGERSKSDRHKSPRSSGSRSSRPHVPRSGSHRERRGGDRKDRDRDREHRSGDRDRHHHRSGGRSRSDGKLKDDDKSHRSDRHRSDRHRSDRDKGDKDHRSRSRTAGVEGKEADDKDKQARTERRISDRERDAEAKRRGRREGASPAAPGASSVADSSASKRPSGGGSSLPAAPLTKEERMSRRTQDEQEAKRRAKEGRTSSSGRSRPGSVADSAASRGSRDQEAKRRAKEERSGGRIAPGAQMADSRGDDDLKRKQKIQGRPGASTSRAADNKKNLQNVKLDYENNAPAEPAAEPKADNTPEAAIGEDGEVAVEAVAIDEEAEENERMRTLEEQNRALADRMEQMIAPVANNHNQAEERRVAAQKEAEEHERKRLENLRKKKKQRNVCILIFLFIAAAGGVAGYFLSQSEDAAAVVPASIPREQNTTAPTAPSTIQTPAPTMVVATEGPSSSPTIDTYDPPSIEDCVRIGSGLPVQGQEDLDTSPFRMEFDITIKDPILLTETWVPAFKRGVDQILIPALAGCPISTTRRGLVAQTAGLRKKQSTTTTLEQETVTETSLRALQTVDSQIRYVIANANSQINPARDVSADCEIKRNGCNNVKVVMELFLKGEERGFDVITLIAQVLQSLEELDRNAGNRQLTLDNETEEQRHHRKLFVNIFKLNPEIFGDIEFRQTVGLDPTTSPSLSPTQVPSIAPSAKPTMVPSLAPTGVPTKKPSPGPTVPPTPGPTVPPTPGPTEQPTPNPTPGPTEQATPEPTPRPTPGPTREPTPFPTPQPNPDPTPQPVFIPQPTPFPTPFLTNSFSSDPSPTYAYSYNPWAENPYTVSPGTPSPSSCPAGFTEDTSFSDSGGDPCSWYINADAPGCPNFGTSYPGTCDDIGECFARDSCCVCLGTPGCVDDPTFKDNSQDGCNWYNQYDQTCQHPTTYGGSCKIGTKPCNAADVCCHCQ